MKTRCCFAEIARRRRDDRALGHDQLPARLDRQPDVLFADELERRLAGSTGRRAGRSGSAGVPSAAGAASKPARPEELVDPPGQGIGADAGRRRGPRGADGSRSAQGRRPARRRCIAATRPRTGWRPA